MSDISKAMDDFADLYEIAKANEKIMNEGRRAVDYFVAMGLIVPPVKSNRGRPARGGAE
jgi:hypothetical protein